MNSCKVCGRDCYTVNEGRGPQPKCCVVCRGRKLRRTTRRRITRVKRLELYACVCGPYVKLGISKCIALRLRGLLCDNPFPIRLFSIGDASSRVDEQQLHDRFKDYHHRLEWFRLEGVLREYVTLKWEEVRGTDRVVCDQLST
jgi:hypothetical protein